MYRNERIRRCFFGGASYIIGAASETDLTNHSVGQNEAIVQQFDNAVAEWNLAGHMIADCSDPDAVNNRFMPMLPDAILDNLDDIDSLYLAEFEKAKTAVNATGLSALVCI